MRTIVQIIAAITFLFLPLQVEAQVTLRGAVATGVGGGGAASFGNVDAVHLNPASLTAGRAGPGIDLGIGRISAFAGGDLLQFKYYNSAFTSGAELTDETAAQIVSDWFGDRESGDVRNAGFGAEAVPLSLAIRFGDWAIASSIRSRTMTKLGVNGGWLDLLLVGDDEARDLPMNAELRLLSTTELSFSVSKSLMGGKIDIGVSPRYILGNEFSENIFESTATVTADSIVHNFDYISRAAGGLGTRVVDNLSFFSPTVFEDERYSPSFLGGAGSGYGLDAGIIINAAPALHVGLSITDLGSVTWNDDAETARPANNKFRFDGLNLDLDELDEVYDGDIVEYAQNVLDSLARGAYEDVIRETGSFSSSLPAALHIGARYAASDKFILSGGSSVSVNQEAGNVAGQPSMHFGGQYLLGGAVGIPLRGGVHVAGSGAMAFAAGLGIHTPVYDFDIGVIFTPYTDVLGAGGRYAVSVSLASISL